MNLNAEEVASRQLQCPHCGGPMEIISELDDYLQEGTPNPGAFPNQPTKPKKRSRGCLISFLITFAILVGLIVYGSTLQSNDPIPQPISISSESNSYVDYNQQSTLYLVRTGDRSYRVAGQTETPDKTLRWSQEDESFYDPEAECWLWYNMDMDPPVWQYWVEGISSDYGDYGWMEHDESGWYIEVSHGDWIEVPLKYNTSNLWFVE